MFNKQIQLNWYPPPNGMSEHLKKTSAYTKQNASSNVTENCTEFAFPYNS